MARHLLLLSLAAAAFGSAQTGQPATFDVVSIKQAVPGARGTPPLSLAQLVTICTMRDNRFSCAGATTLGLVRTAFPYEDGSLRPTSQIVGGPDWMKTLQFNIDARTPPGVTMTPAQAPGPLRALLE